MDVFIPLRTSVEAAFPGRGSCTAAPPASAPLSALVKRFIGLIARPYVLRTPCRAGRRVDGLPSAGHIQDIDCH